MHYKPSPLTSLSGRKSWELFAFPIEKINFFFWLAKIVGRLKKLSHPQGDVRSIRFMLKNVPHSWINKVRDTEFYIWQALHLGKCKALKMKGHLETDTFFHKILYVCLCYIVANAYCCQENRGYTFRHVLGFIWNNLFTRNINLYKKSEL